MHLQCKISVRNRSGKTLSRPQKTTVRWRRGAMLKQGLRKPSNVCQKFPKCPNLLVWSPLVLSCVQHSRSDRYYVLFLDSNENTATWSTSEPAVGLKCLQLVTLKRCYINRYKEWKKGLRRLYCDVHLECFVNGQRETTDWQRSHSTRHHLPNNKERKEILQNRWQSRYMYYPPQWRPCHTDREKGWWWKRISCKFLK